jgi:hypothetical protein
MRRGNTTGVYLVSPWESRERGGLYYTRSRKEDGRVVREYVGGGILGELAAQMDAERRRQRKEEEVAQREERGRLDALVAPLEELCEAAEIIARAALVASGYHRHNRGEWRKRREQRS